VDTENILFNCVYGFFIDAVVFFCDDVTGLWKLSEVCWPSVTARFGHW
jgi:hypothetical protein